MDIIVWACDKIVFWLIMEIMFRMKLFAIYFDNRNDEIKMEAQRASFFCRVSVFFVLYAIYLFFQGYFHFQDIKDLSEIGKKELG